MSALSRFNTLATLTLDSGVSHQLFGTHADFDSTHFYRRQELRAVGPGITRLILRGSFTPCDVLWLLACFPSLEVLEVQLAPKLMDTEDAQDVMICRKTFASLPRLARLILDEDAVEALILPDCPHLEWGFSSFLRSIKVNFKSKWLDAVSAFAALSASTLASLDIALLPPDDPAEEDTPADGLANLPAPFPHLRHLRAEGDLPDVEKCIHHFKSSPVISLALQFESEDPSSVTKLVKSACRLFGQHLKTLHVDTDPERVNKPKVNSSDGRLVDFAARRGIAFDLAPCYDVFFDRGWSKDMSNAGWRHDGTVRQCSGVNEVLRFGLAQSARIWATDDVVAAEQLVVALAPMKAWMMRLKD